jgi:hypothetical protein
VLLARQTVPLTLPFPFNLLQNNRIWY